MPDPNKRTISASQAPALFNVSPYVTRWMLYQYFANNVPLPEPDNTRVDAGTRLQTAILNWAADELNLEVVENNIDQYYIHQEHRLGCTPDGSTVCPSRGLGVVEAKNVDWLIWKKEWTETAAPRHIEIQLQQQMLVAGAKWGVIACLVGGNELLLYEREINLDLWDALAQEADQFFQDVKDGNEPDPFGHAEELTMLADLYPEADPEIIIEIDDDDFMMDLVTYENAKATAALNNKAAKELQAKLLGKTKDAGIVVCQDGTKVYIKKTQIKDSKVKLDPEVEGAIKTVKPEFDGIVTRKGYVMTKINIVAPSAMDEEAGPDYGGVA